MITIYTKDHCMQCRFTKKWLDEHGVEYSLKNVDADPTLTEELQQLGFRAVPVVVAEGYEPFYGFQPQTLEKIISED
ncbi:MAG: glutaredoxin-like protein NrdH [Aerococcus sanguinicola]